jgi:putative transposase
VYIFTPLIEGRFRKRNKYTSYKFLVTAIHQMGCLKVINIDQSAVNIEVIKTYNKRCFRRIGIRQCKYLNNRVEADHRFIRWRTQQLLGIRNFKSAQRTLTGIKIVGMIKKEKVVFPLVMPYQTFCSLAV